jgi:hypothetical protein
MEPRMPPQDARSSTWLGAAMALAGSTGIAAAWVAVSMLSASQCGWMALIAALDAAWLLRLGGATPGVARMVFGVIATALAIALAQWGIVSAHLAGMMGLGFLDTALRLGPSLAWTMAELANGPVDMAFLAIGLVLAAFASR